MDNVSNSHSAMAEPSEGKLRSFLDDLGLGHGPLDIAPVGHGHSNLTYLLRRGDEHLILRRPPRPPFPPSAHDVLREARLLEAVSGDGVRVPRLRAVCAETGILGAPFYVMSELDGVVIGTELPETLSSAADRWRIGCEAIDALVEIHAFDWLERGLGTLRRPGSAGYLERQLMRFSELWARTCTRSVPGMGEVIDWLRYHRPKDSAVTLVHGDYRLGNLMFAHNSPAQLIAVLDWEMWAIGDPLADLGYLVANWAQTGDPPGPMRELCPVTEQAGFPSRAALVARYAEASGGDVPDLRYYVVLALWKSAVFLEGSYRRFRDGTTHDPFFGRLETGVPQLVETAFDATRGAEH